MSELLLELYIEEIPALMQKNAQMGYKEIYSKALEDIPYDRLNTYIGARRIALHISGLPKEVAGQNIEVKGPKTSAPKGAIEGFCRANNTSIDNLTIKELKDEKYYFFEQNTEAKPIKDILPKILADKIGKYIWPKSMYWNDHKIKFVRPLLNILCILDGEVLDVEYGHLKSNNKSFGHRFASYNAFEVSSFEDYKSNLEKNYVILDRDERVQVIENSIQKIEEKYNIKIQKDSKLLEEAAGLNEHINLLIGKIDHKFLSLPAEALITSMKVHQKFFSSKTKNGEFAPYFIFVSNVPTNDPSAIIAGNEKVLYARLSDALYFYEQDLKTSLEHRLSSLSGVIFHANIGTMEDKYKRLVELAKYLDSSNHKLAKAAMLCKADLTSEMVKEFPELQGIMGYYYALHENLDQEISESIRDHYLSENIDNQFSAKIALIDKLDSLTGLMIAGVRATGSKDPYALRRAALSIIKIITQHKLEIDLPALVRFAASLFDQKEIILTEILSFIEDRIKNHLKDNYSHELIKACLDLESDKNILIILAKLDLLKDFVSSKEGEELIVIYKRASNIISGNQDSKVDASLFSANEEKSLYNKILEIEPQVKNSLKSNGFKEALHILLSIKSALSVFFDKVIVNDDNPKIANNRKAILKLLSNLFKQIAHFEHL